MKVKRPLREDAFPDFAHSSWPRLYRSAFLLVGDHGEAEDLAQAALTSTYTHWGRLRSPDAAFSYARTSLLNEARRRWRLASWGKEDARADLPEPRAAADTTDPALRPTIIDALRTLPPRQRAVIVLRYYEDLTIAQTAHHLRCTAGTVKSQTSDALATLRLILGDTRLEGALHV